MIVSIDIYTYLITTLIGREEYNIECTRPQILYSLTKK